MLSHWNWQKLFSYGEVMCFVTAWAVGLLVARESSRPANHRVAVRSFAASSDVSGIQARLTTVRARLATK
jgi:hypothetical protein